MNRRVYLKTIALTGAASALPAAPPRAIQLHVDMEVDPAREKEMLGNYHKLFHPAIVKQPGYVDVKLLKLVSVMDGPAPGQTNYRLIISFQTEEQRKAWVATAEHKKVWPTIEKTLKSAHPGVILFDVVV